MRLNLLVWFVVNGLPVQPDCDPDHITSTLQSCVEGCFTKRTKRISPCIQKCQIRKAKTEKQCDEQKGKIKFDLTIIKLFIAEKDIDECKLGTDECGDNAVCYNTMGSYQCLCKTGYVMVENKCFYVDSCLQSLLAGRNSCGENGSCVHGALGFQCECNSGFILDGESCVDADECGSGQHNCHLFATCTNTVAGFECACLEGFVGNGTTCIDVDECDTSVHQCDTNAQCVNNQGSYVCESNNGYQGDGMNSSKGKLYVVSYGLCFNYLDSVLVLYDRSKALVTNTRGEVNHPQWSNVGQVSSRGWCGVVFRNEIYIFGQVLSQF